MLTQQPMSITTKLNEVTMKKILPIIVVSIGLSACGQSGPGENEIRSALASVVNDKKGCAYDRVLFKEFPIPESIAGKNKHILQPFFNIGFIKENGGSYELTEQGRAVYDAKVPGFCYTDHYISKYPPAEPGALDCEPLKAGGWGRYRDPKV
jgi:hypothetical protein